MSLSSDINTTSTSLADIKTAIINKGVTPSGNITTYADAINQINGEDLYKVMVIDYDGTVLKEADLVEGAVFTLPEAPTGRPRLTFQEWACPVDITNNTITVENFDIIIGAIYKPTSELDEYDIELNADTGLTVTFMAPASGGSTATVDWGDGTTSICSWGETTEHNYSDYGIYTITINSAFYFAYPLEPADCLIAARIAPIHFQTSGTDLFLQPSNYYKNLEYVTFPKEIINAGTYISGNINLRIWYCDKLKVVTFPNNMPNFNILQVNYNRNLEYAIVGKSNNFILPVNFLYVNYKLKRFTIPKGTTSIGNSALYQCYNLKSPVVVPDTVTSIGNNAFQYCQSVENMIIPSSVTSLGTSAIQYLYNLKKFDYNGNYSNFSTTQINISRSYCLKELNLGSNVTSIPASFCNSLYPLEKVTFTANLLTINANAFNKCYNVLEYDFSNHQSIPTLANINAFTSINPECKILVPSALESSWKEATNWSTYADYIVGV